ncbi:MAG: hypothetical protein QXI16_02165 [Sulfolobaceae archaeon]
MKFRAIYEILGTFEITYMVINIDKEKLNIENEIDCYIKAIELAYENQTIDKILSTLEIVSFV